MNFSQAKRKALLYRIAGASIALPSLISTIISLLKMLYFRLSDGSALGNAIAAPFQKLIAEIFKHTHQYVGFFWQKSPIPDLMSPFKTENLPFVIIYFLIFIGYSIFFKGNKLAVQLREINQEIENQLIRESLHGQITRNRKQIEEELNIPSSKSIFSQWHQMYLAPLLVAIIGGIIVAVLIKLLGI
ncbi:YniB family protein [Acinetobacter vivianii]|uniref:YniB family protein n=1 Tax=Acinetobacter vivianii TaxID=1776742 RepID=UPI002DB7EDFC|nr:YniB family protein [Acinetobacter vivianii]MEB6480258.1 YniB family protein [Acinetobacter vivianii]MEB6658705.1 YniB family protein [Acinetobacter vivianii]